jgi:hypothetical protein
MTSKKVQQAGKPDKTEVKIPKSKKAQQLEAQQMKIKARLAALERKYSSYDPNVEYEDED